MYLTEINKKQKLTETKKEKSFKWIQKCNHNHVYAFAFLKQFTSKFFF